MKARTLIATFWYTESNRKEEKEVTILISDEANKYVLTKVYVVELRAYLVFDKEMNEFLVAD